MHITCIFHLYNITNTHLYSKNYEVNVTHRTSQVVNMQSRTIRSIAIVNCVITLRLEPTPWHVWYADSVIYIFLGTNTLLSLITNQYTFS